MMSARLRSDIWVSAYIRRCAVEGVVAVLRRRGSAEAGVVYVKVDLLDGRATLYAPLPSDDEIADRRFEAVLIERESLMVEERMAREISFDPDLWLVEVEDRNGRSFLDLPN